jgi:hypothetical protein
MLNWDVKNLEGADLNPGRVTMWQEMRAKTITRNTYDQSEFGNQQGIALMAAKSEHSIGPTRAKTGRTTKVPNRHRK